MRLSLTNTSNICKITLSVVGVPITIYPLLNEPYLPRNHVQILVPKVVYYHLLFVCLMILFP